MTIHVLGRASCLCTTRHSSNTPCTVNLKMFCRDKFGPDVVFGLSTVIYFWLSPYLVHFSVTILDLEGSGRKLPIWCWTFPDFHSCPGGSETNVCITEFPPMTEINAWLEARSKPKLRVCLPPAGLAHRGQALKTQCSYKNMRTGWGVKRQPK